MRIGIDISKALGPPDGIGRYIAGLLGGLIEMAADGALAGHSFHLYALYDAPLEGTAAQALRRRFGALPASFVCEAARAPASGEVDLFHCTTHSVPVGYDGPLLFTVYDLTFLTLPATHTLANRMHCTRGLARAMARGAALVAISQSTRQELASLLALDAAAIPVVTPAVDARFGPREPAVIAAMRARLGLERPYLLSVGTLEPRKNLPRLMEAFAALDAEQTGERVLAIAGASGWRGGEGSAAPEELASRLGLLDGEGGARVRFLGRVEDDDLPALYAGAELFAYPSLAEGFGLPALEAMACGVPVLVSDRTSLPEVVGDAALMVDPESVEAIGAGLLRLLSDGALAARLRLAGPQRARRFTWRASAEGQVAAYEEAVADRRRPLGMAAAEPAG